MKERKKDKDFTVGKAETTQQCNSTTKHACGFVLSTMFAMGAVSL